LALHHQLVVAQGAVVLALAHELEESVQERAAGEESVQERAAGEESVRERAAGEESVQERTDGVRSVQERAPGVRSVQDLEVVQIEEDSARGQVAFQIAADFAVAPAAFQSDSVAVREVARSGSAVDLGVCRTGFVDFAVDRGVFRNGFVVDRVVFRNGFADSAFDRAVFQSPLTLAPVADQTQEHYVSLVAQTSQAVLGEER